MTSQIERQAAASGSPASATIGPIRVATVTSTAVIAIPAEWLGKYVRFRLVDGTRSYIRFGTVIGVDVDATTNNTVDGSTKVVTVGTKQPHLVLEPGESVDEFVDSSWLYFAHIEGATGGFLIAALKTAAPTS